MKKIARLVVNHKLTIVIVFAVLTVISVVCIPFVNINYNDVEYLPESNSLKVGINTMYQDFGKGGNSTIMVHNVSVADMVNMNKDIENMEGVAGAMWIDDLLLSKIDPSSFGEDIPEDMQPLINTLLGEDGKNLAEIINKPEDKAVAMVLDLLKVIMSIPVESRASVNIIKNYINTNQTVLNKNSAAEYSEKWPNYDTEFKALYDLAINTLSLIPNLDAFDLSQIDMIASQLDGFYKKDQNNVNYALIQLSFTGTDYDKGTQAAIEGIQEYMNERGYTVSMVGNAITTYNSVQVLSKESSSAMVLAGIVVIIVLLLTTSSYWEPVLLLIPMAVAIALNMGSNIIMSKISYMTNSIASVLQLALTMDYSIYLLNRFKQEKNKGLSSKDAMAEALANGATAISSASLTTIASFVALMFMSYRLGLDVGIVLAKGVVFSMISVFLLLPVLTLYTEKLIEKTAHKTFNFSFRKFSKKLLKHRMWMPIMLIAIFAIGMVFQSQNLFVYGQEASLSSSEKSDFTQGKNNIENIFGKQNQALVLLSYKMFDENKDGTLSEEEKAAFDEREIEFSEELMKISGVKSVQSWSIIEASGASAMLPASFKAQFIADEHTRVIVALDLPEEGEETTIAVMHINSLIEEIYGDKIELTGETPHHLGNSSATLEIKNLVTSDYNLISNISLALVALIVLIAFKSLIIPILLVVVIQGAIYVNMAIPYFQQEPIVFVGYMIVSGILLGATIDYAIVMTSNYIEHRAKMNKYNAMQHAIADSIRTLLTSAGILTFAGLILTMTTSSSAVAVFGNSIFRGGILSFAFVVLLLPQLLVIFDGVIRATTWNGKKLMIENNLSLNAPDVMETVILPPNLRKKKRVNRLEIEVDHSSSEGADPDILPLNAGEKARESLSETEADGESNSLRDSDDFMEESIVLFKDEDAAHPQRPNISKSVDFVPLEAKKREKRDMLPDISPEPPVIEDDKE